ncbi:hypothetical protein [Maribacter sp. 2304DJ31-5]|uniref:hypothetical protein n=1 Tax=Maribacter sp. 2304DJ31-5 TaxID=3386273 RepID=UPI0039BD0F4D
MESHNIEELLEKYFEATATVEEEQILRDYFSKGKIAPHLEQYAPMFQYFSRAKEERFTGQVSLKHGKAYYKWAAIAAVAVFAFGAYFGSGSYRDYREKQLEDQEKALAAYHETKKAFALLAENFSKGTQKMTYLNEFEVTKQKIYNHN